MSMIITFLFWALLPDNFPQSDSSDYPNYYEPVARRILSGAGVVRQDGTPAITYPPGYPILLAGVFAMARFWGLPENLVHSGFILLCMGLSSMFVFLLAQKIWGMRGGWLSALFFMTYPFVLWLTKQLNSEVPFMAAFYASLYIFWLGLKGHKNAWILLL
ncbi:MAG: glycosyltransferase family 39 protein, partial [Nanoarchaeota archaeon]|nr:glycosyltransferase family 39 protein [Nanoarchaeota archaeon]